MEGFATLVAALRHSALVLAAFQAAERAGPITNPAELAPPALFADDPAWAFRWECAFGAHVLRLARDGTVDQWFRGCTGAGHDAGFAVAFGRAVDVVWRAHAPLAPRHTRYWRIPWDTRTFLVEDARLLDFVNAVNRRAGADGPVPGMFLATSNDERAALAGRPLLPEPWGRFVHDPPLVGRVIEAEGQGAAARVVVDLGPRHDLRPGMWLWIEARGERQAIGVAVERVERGRTLCAPLTPGDAAPWLGRRVSTAE